MFSLIWNSDSLLSPKNIMEYYVGWIERIMVFPCRQTARDLAGQVTAGLIYYWCPFR